MATRQSAAKSSKTTKVTKVTKADAQAGKVPGELKQLRKSIDSLDTALICILAERCRVTERVGHIKAEHRLPAQDPAREAEQTVRVRALAKRSGLDPDLAEQVHRVILKGVVQRHRAIAAGQKKTGRA